MAKSDHTTPWKVVESRGECRKDVCGGGYPCSHFSISKTLKVYKRKQGRAERVRVRDSLNKGIEPAGQQHRHRALWDAS